MLNLAYKGIRQGWKVSAFWNVLPYKFICILNWTFLPWTIWIGKEHEVRILRALWRQSLGDQLMRTELRTVVGCYGAYGFSIREQQPDHHFSQRLGMLAFGQPLHEYHVGASLGKCQDGPLAVSSCAYSMRRVLFSWFSFGARRKFATFAPRLIVYTYATQN